MAQTNEKKKGLSSWKPLGFLKSMLKANPYVDCNAVLTGWAANVFERKAIPTPPCLRTFYCLPDNKLIVPFQSVAWS